VILKINDVLKVSSSRRPLCEVGALRVRRHTHSYVHSRRFLILLLLISRPSRHRRLLTILLLLLLLSENISLRALRFGAVRV